MIKSILIAVFVIFLVKSGVPQTPDLQKKSLANVVTVENSEISLTFDLSNRVSLMRIVDRATGFNFLSQPSPFFQYAVNYTGDIKGVRNNGLGIDSHTLSADHKTLIINCHVNNPSTLSFKIQVTTAEGSKAAVVSTTVKNAGDAKVFLKLLMPDITNLTLPGIEFDHSRMLGMIPQEIGGVTTLANGVTMGNAGDKLEELSQQISQLPGAFNVMEVADIYDRDGHGGVFFADMDGNVSRNIEPIQFILSQGKVRGYWAQFVEGHTEKVLSRLAIGVHQSGDYHASVDFYTKAHANDLHFPSSPAWFKEAGGYWSTNEEGSGGAFELWPKRKDLNTQIKSFTELPALYNSAVAMGTNIFYLNDYWEGDGSPERYLIKGDYIPRADLGGKAALIQGIKGIHARGGKVIMYVEPFIISTTSNIGKKYGEGWAARDTAGNLWLPWGPNYVMLAPYKPWQDYISDVAKRIVQEYGADGIFLDSWGWRYNVSYRNSNDNILYTAQQWSLGVHELADKVLSKIRSVKPDAVVLSESGGGELPMHENGGSSADFVWGSAANEGRIIASPVRYGMPDVHFFSNGYNLNHTIQVYAAGQQLALNYKWDASAPFIKKLLDLRRQYKDAMVYGRQTYQPNTGTMRVGAYFYKGTSNNIITVANVDSAAHTINMKLGKTEANTAWTDVLTGEKFKARGDALVLPLGGAASQNHGLRVLLQKRN